MTARKRSSGTWFFAFMFAAGLLGAAEPELAAVSQAIRKQIGKNEIAGAVAWVATPDRVVHFAAVGQADLASKTPLLADALFWIASMSKPVTACAILMLQDEGKLSVDDPVSKYLPELANLKTADGAAGAPTLKHLLTHTSGLSEPSEQEALAARTLAELMPHIASKPLVFLPGTRWQYSQSGINSLGRIVEIVSGKPLPVFLEERLFVPLGMKDTTFYPTAAQRARLAKAYRRETGKLEAAEIKPIYDCARGDARYPAANGGLYSTAADYGRFCRMLLNNGALDGKRILSPAAVAAMSAVQSGDLKTGFTAGMGWGLGCGVVRQPQGVTAMLSPGTFGHGGAYGTQAWVDPVKKVAYVLMVQRANFPNGDDSELRRDFQDAAAKALASARLDFSSGEGQEISPWVPGTLEIHQISTGRGNAGLYIFPDGTTMLVDAGEIAKKTERHTPDRPDGTRPAGEWVTRYIRHALRHDAAPVLDYALVTHFHEDHMGEVTADTPLSGSGAYRLSGLTAVGDKIRIGKLMDRGWPDYTYPRELKAAFVTNYQAFVKWQSANKAMSIEAFSPGRNDQVVLRRDAAKYPDFEFRNVGANGIIWTGKGTETQPCIPSLETVPKADWPDENVFSTSFRIRYGKFDYFNGGDIRGIPYEGFPQWHDVETPIAKAIGAVDAAILNHHGYVDTMNEFFVATLRPRVWVISVWDSAHPTTRVWNRLRSQRVYPGPREIFATDAHEAALNVIGGLGGLSSRHGHIVIRVAPGGDEYRVLIVDDSSESHRVTKAFGPYKSKAEP